MMKSKYVLPFLMLLAVICRAELAGDINQDGKLDISDYVRLNAMIAKALTEQPDADLDGDGKVNSVDADMLMGLIRGTFTMPRKLDYTRSTEYVLDEDGDSSPMACHAVDGFKVLWSAYYRNLSDISLWTVESLPDSPFTDDFTGKLSKTIGISNLPRTDTRTFILDVPENAQGTPALLLGSLLYTKGYKESGWVYRILEVDGEELKYANNQLTWTPGNCDAYPYLEVSPPITLTVIYSTDTSRRLRHLGSSNTDGQDIEFQTYHSDYGYSTYLCKHFLIQPYGYFSETNIRRLAEKLEKAYRIIGGLGFKQTMPWNWGKRIRVNIRKSSGKEDAEYAYCAGPGLLSGPQLEFNDGVLASNHIGNIAIHELMHFHHYIYNHSNYTCLWLEEMCTTWAESLMADDPENYIPSTYEDSRAVLDGLPKASFKPALFSSDYKALKDVSEHGYNLYPFAVWLTKKYGAEELWWRIFSSRGYEIGQALTAVRQALAAVANGEDIGDLYDEFVREYFSGKGTIPYCDLSVTPFKLLDSSSTSKCTPNSKKTLIKKAGDLFLKENIEYTFQMPHLGTATWFYQFNYNTDEFMRDYSEAIIKINGTQYDFFILRFENHTFSMSAPEEIERDEDNNCSTFHIPLDTLGRADRRTGFGIVVINHNYDEYTVGTNNVTISIGFSGPLTVTGLVSKTTFDEFINGAYRWIHDYTAVQSDLTFTPLGKTTFADSEVYVFKTGYNGVYDEIPMVTTHLATKEIPQTLEVNIAGVLTDLPVPPFIYDAGARFFGLDGGDGTMWAESTGKHVVKVSKTVERYSYDVYFSTGDGVGESNAVTGGMTYSAEDFAPSGPKGRSRLTVTIPDIDPNATSYSITIESHYLQYFTPKGSDNVSNRGSFENNTCHFEIILK